MAGAKTKNLSACTACENTEIKRCAHENRRAALGVVTGGAAKGIFDLRWRALGESFPVPEIVSEREAGSDG